MLKRVMKNNAGAAMTEYIIILALVAIAAITVVRTFGTRIRNMFDGATNQLNAVEVAPVSGDHDAGGPSSTPGGTGSNNNTPGGLGGRVGNMVGNAVNNLAN